MKALEGITGLCHTQVVFMWCQVQYYHSENEKLRSLGFSLFNKGTVRLSQAFKSTASDRVTVV